MVKIFVGNIAASTTVDQLRNLFTQYGKITECDIVKNFGFVHMNNKAEAEEAIRNLHQYDLNGERMNVEMSKGRPKSTTKLHVSNIGEGASAEELKAKFEEFGSVVECDIVKDYAFVHMERMEDATDAISKLDNTAFKGKLMSVQLSTSRLRTAPGMGDQTGCYVCGRQGHWSKECPVGRNGSPSDGARGRSGRALPRGPPGYGRGGYGMARTPGSDYMSASAFSRAGYPAGLPPPPPRRLSYGAELGERYAGRVAAAAYPDRSSAYDRDRYTSSIDYYEKYRARPYGSSYFEEGRLSYIPPPPPPSSSLSRLSSGIDPYDRRPLAPPSSAAAAAAAAASYYARDRSPIRRVPVTSAGYAYERSRLSPVSASRSAAAAAYAVPRAKDPYAVARYAPY